MVVALTVVMVVDLNVVVVVVNLKVVESLRIVAVLEKKTYNISDKRL